VPTVIRSAIAAASLACSTAAHANTPGNDLFSACRNYAFENTRANDQFNRAVCSGIVEGAAVVASVHGEVCFPRGVTNAQMAMVVVTYMTQHPETTHNDLALITEAALMQACMKPRSCLIPIFRSDLQ
jgi:Rap1a immunity proteins